VGSGSKTLDEFARIWFDGWRDAHCKILSAEIAHFRTLESFSERLQAASNSVRVAERQAGGCEVGTGVLDGRR
jgi:hypothetical protein